MSSSSRLTLDRADGAVSAPPRLSERHFRLLIVGAFIGYFLLLVQLYDRIVAPRFAFGSFVLDPAPGGIVVPLGLVILASFLTPAYVRRVSDLFVWLSMLLLLVPAAVLAARQNSDIGALVMMFTGVAAVMLFRGLYERLQIIKSLPPLPPEDVSINWAVMVGISVLVLFLLIAQSGGRFSLPFADVYDLRFDFNEQLGFPLNYLLPFAGGPLSGLIVGAAMRRRNYLLVALAVVFGVLFFGFSTHKALLFYPPFALMGYFLMRVRLGGLAVLALLSVLSIATMAVSGGAEDILGSSFANRLIFIPAQIHYFFFREFADIGFQYWAESRLSLGLVRSNLPIDSVNYIGLLMTGNAAVGANTGWIANGYMNLGIIGILFYAALLGGILYYLDKISDRYGASFIAASFIIPVSNFVNSIDLLAGALTGGFLLLVGVFMLTVRPARARSNADG